ncbi:hypothetical protein [Novosphingobium sp. P6W]|nr:hypothetical protein [Novosphingobium sp. P6W]
MSKEKPFLLNDKDRLADVRSSEREQLGDGIDRLRAALAKPR